MKKNLIKIISITAICLLASLTDVAAQEKKDVVAPEQLLRALPKEEAKKKPADSFLKVFVDKVILQKYTPPDQEGRKMNLGDLLAAGGFCMYPIYICSILCITMVIFLQLSLTLNKIAPQTFVQQVNTTLSENGVEGIEDAINLCKRSKTAIANIFLTGLEKIDKSITVIREVIQAKGDFFANRVEKYVGVLSAIATVAPMFGLLGTVTGMIQCFNTIAFEAGMGKPTLLAAGVSQALVTTAAGLIVGIPAMIFYFIYRAKARDIILIIGDNVEDFLRQISSLKETGIVKEVVVEK